MGFLDRMKTKLAPAKDKVSNLAQQHGDKIDHGLEKAAKVVDEKTKGKYSDKIQAGTGKAKHAVDRLAAQDQGKDKDDGGSTTPPPSTPPTPPPAP
ncbi:antitoxin [Streptomyces sp. G5(2025)]|uniref:antitoxin n=1 Tax=Streptomyces sp. G5(2025) TaxID=3406628 RepID=UPI003C1FA285